MSWLDERSKEQRANDSVWYQAGARSERMAILSLLEDYLAKDTSFRSLDEVVDYIRAGGHHE